MDIRASAVTVLPHCAVRNAIAGAGRMVHEPTRQHTHLPSQTMYAYPPQIDNPANEKDADALVLRDVL